MVTRINRTAKGGATYTSIGMEEVVEMLRSGAFAAEVRDFRDEISIRMATNDMPLGKLDVPVGIPKLCFSALWRKKSGQLELQQYNGLVVLEISNLPTMDEALRLRKEAARIPYTRIAYVGVTGRDVVIVCAVAADGMENMRLEQLKALHLSAYKRLHYLYSSQLLLALDNKKPELDMAVAVSDDSDACYNPKSETFYVSEVDVDVPVFRGTRNDVEPQLLDREVVPLHTIFEWCVTAAWEKAREYAAARKIKDEYEIAEHALHELAANCNDANIPIDYGVRRASWYRQFRGDMNYIERVFANAYEEKASRNIPYGFVNKNALMAYKIEAFMEMHYELRRNVLTGVVQYRKKDGYDYDFQDLTDEAMNTMTNRAVKAGIGSWDKDVRRIINSNDVREFDPIADYIFSLPKWDGKDRIAELVGRIPTDTPNVYLYLRIWLLAMVAHWLGRDTRHGNALVPLFIGHQGCGKTTLCGMILPPELSDYYNDKVNFKNETDLNLGLSSFALINIDEFDSVKKSQQPVLKYLLSKSEVRMRPPYGKAYVSRRRYASFIATTNQGRPLVDKTGSRRFACIHILPDSSIDTSTPINYDQLYAQLMQEVYDGARYWLNDEETRVLIEQNGRYRTMTDLAEMVDTVFTPAKDETEGRYLTTYELIDILENHFPELNRTASLNRDLGKVLKAKHFTFHKKNTGVSYLVKKPLTP
ncbi:MAG: DUF5906 domain-containing protein [Bacteroidaceae bacterium]|nr:DUF5906 domain-containing protein [Bacteroidaceae bacterium]